MTDERNKRETPFNRENTPLIPLNPRPQVKKGLFSHWNEMYRLHKVATMFFAITGIVLLAMGSMLSFGVTAEMAGMQAFIAWTIGGLVGSGIFGWILSASDSAEKLAIFEKEKRITRDRDGNILYPEVDFSREHIAEHNRLLAAVALSKAKKIETSILRIVSSALILLAVGAWVAYGIGQAAFEKMVLAPIALFTAPAIMGLGLVVLFGAIALHVLHSRNPHDIFSNPHRRAAAVVASILTSMAGVGVLLMGLASYFGLPTLLGNGVVAMIAGGAVAGVALTVLIVTLWWSRTPRMPAVPKPNVIQLGNDGSLPDRASTYGGFDFTPPTGLADAGHRPAPPPPAGVPPLPGPLSIDSNTPLPAPLSPAATLAASMTGASGPFSSGNAAAPAAAQAPAAASASPDFSR